METGSYDPNGIIAGDHPLTHQPITVLSGEGALIRGTVMGQISVGAAVAAAKAGGNTGAGTLTMDAVTPVRAGAKAGIYTVRLVEAVGAGGIWEVKDPDGFNLGQALVGATFDNDLKFASADVGADFIVGDGFDITVAAGSGKWKKAVAAAVDGSATPKAILAEDLDATAADVVGPAYREGEFAHEMLTYGAGHTAVTVEAAFRANAQPIYLKSIGVVA